MSYSRRIKFEYFEVVYRKNTDSNSIPDRKFDLSLWMNKVDKSFNDLESRQVEYFAEKARLDDFWYEKSVNLWVLSFVRLRESNIPNIAKNTAVAEPMELEDDEYIGENACGIYDKSNGVIMLQRNIHSLSVTGIEAYINRLWNSENETIYLRPILNTNIQEKVKKAQNYRRLTVRFADLNQNAYMSKEEGSLKKIIDGLTGYEAINAEISITVGRKQGKSLNRATVTDTIETITENKHMITKAEIGFKDTDDTSVEILDLFEDKMQDSVYVSTEQKKGVDIRDLSCKMIERYFDSQSKVNQALRERT